METNNLKAGDVVQVKSGGPHMTIEKISDSKTDETTGKAWCVWFGRMDSEPFFRWISVMALNRI